MDSKSGWEGWLKLLGNYIRNIYIDYYITTAFGWSIGSLKITHDKNSKKIIIKKHDFHEKFPINLMSCNM